MKRLGLKLASLIIALVIWIQVASNYEVEETLDLPLRLENLPPGYTLAGNEIPSKVRVRLLGSKLRLLAHRYFNFHVGYVEVDLSTVESAVQFQRVITRDDVRTDLRVDGFPQTEILNLYIDTEEFRQVAVTVVATGRLPEGWQLLESPVAEPDSIILSGPTRHFQGHETVRTEPVALDRIRESVTRVKPIQSPSELLVPAVQEVQVTVLVATIEVRTFANIPVVALKDPDQTEVNVFPPVADLVFSGPADSINVMEPVRIAVTLSLSGLSEGIHHLRGQIDKPTCLSFVSIAPETFMAIVGDISQLEEPVDQP